MPDKHSESEFEGMSVTRAKQTAVGSLCQSRMAGGRGRSSTPPRHEPRLQDDDHNHDDHDHATKDTASTPPKAQSRKRRIVLIGKQVATILRKQAQHKHEHQQEQQSSHRPSDGVDSPGSPERGSNHPPRAPAAQAQQAHRREHRLESGGTVRNKEAQDRAAAAPTQTGRMSRRPRSPAQPSKSS